MLCKVDDDKLDPIKGYNDVLLFDYCPIVWVLSK